MLTTTPDLPKYCYLRGKKIWIRYKDEYGKWVNRKTPYTAAQTESARHLITSVLRGVEAKRASGEFGPDCLREYVKRWAKERAVRGVSSADADLAKLEKHVLPRVGDMRLEEFRPRHARDVVRALRSLKDDQGHPELAPRTINHIFAALYNVFENAMVDELVYGENPVRVKAGELPKKVDADPEWRSQATFVVPEVVDLLTNELIPVERRVQYALKALAGLRHGEVAALAWRHLDFSAQPLGRMTVAQAWDTIGGVLKRTKTEETRSIPIHPTLAKILVAWRDVHWPRIYGRAPTPDDFVVPTPDDFAAVSGHDACKSFKRDLLALGLRVQAGTRRDRGGHDLRAWYETRCVEDGADSMLIRRTTHAPPKTVAGGYERFSWATLCREVAKLTLEIPSAVMFEPL